jgi:prophage antirepressor-like protein
MKAKENALQVFNFSENNSPVRVVMNENNPLFCLADVCRILGLSNSREVAKRLNQKGVILTDTLTAKGTQRLTYVNEGNLYKVIFRSDKPSARKFEEWVTDEVLPSIRKTGSYAMPAAPVRKYTTRGELINAEVLHLLWLIAESLPHGSQKKLAFELGVSENTISKVLTGKHRNARILKALYDIAYKNRQQLLLYNQPALMAKRLLMADLSPEEMQALNNNPLPVVQVDNNLPVKDNRPRVVYTVGSKYGNQNARKYPKGEKHKQMSGAAYRRLKKEREAAKAIATEHTQKGCAV